MPPQNRPNEHAGQAGNEHDPAALTPVTARPAPELLATGHPPAGSPIRGSSFRMLLRFKRTIILIALVIALPALAAIWKFVDPLYVASGEIRVRPIIPHLVFLNEDNGAVPYYQNYLNTQVALVISPTVLQRALTQPDVRETEWFRQAGQSRLFASGSRLEKLRAQLEVRPRPRTEVIDVIFESASGRDSAVIVNVVLDEYLRHAREISSIDSDRIYVQLIEQHDILKRQLREKEQAIQQLHRQLGTTDPEQLIAEKRQRLDLMEIEYDESQRSQALIQWRLVRMSEEIGRPTTMPASEMAYAHDVEWWRLKEELDRLGMTLEIERENLGEMHPHIRELLRQQQFTRQTLVRRERQLDSGIAHDPTRRQWFLVSRGRLLDETGGPVDRTGMLAVNPIQVVRDELGLTEYSGKLLADSIDRQRQAWRATFAGAELLSERLAELNDVRELYEAVKGRLESKRMERNVPGSIEILARAIEPRAISKDRRIAFSALAVLAALAAGMMAAGLRASLQQPMVEASMLPAAPVGPFVGLLPEIRSARQLPMNHPRLQERVRTLRTVLLQRVDRGDGNVVMLTSSQPREGKTTISVMLARSLAQCGKRVLLVDADMHNPQVAKTLGVKPPTGGFLQGLAHGKSGSEVVVDTPVPRLRLAPGAVSRTREESDAFGSGAFPMALDQWRAEYDVVLVDTAPVLASADALILAPRVDGMIFVVRTEQTPAGSMREALNYLTSVGANIWGTAMIGHECAGDLSGPSCGSN